MCHARPSLAPRLGNSLNWKVCGSKLCNKNNAKGTKIRKASTPEECVFGGWRYDTTTTTWTNLNPTGGLSERCSKKFSGGCTAGSGVSVDGGQASKCLGNCCASGSIGRCPTSSCHANALGTEERK